VRTDRWIPFASPAPFEFAVTDDGTPAGVRRTPGSGERTEISYAWNRYHGGRPGEETIEFTRRIHLIAHDVPPPQVAALRDNLVWAAHRLVNERRYRLPAIQPDRTTGPHLPGPLLHLTVTFTNTRDDADTVVHLHAGVPAGGRRMRQDTWYADVHPTAHLHEILLGLGIRDDTPDPRALLLPGGPATATAPDGHTSLMGRLGDTASPYALALTPAHLQQIADVLTPYLHTSTRPVLEAEPHVRAGEPNRNGSEPQSADTVPVAVATTSEDTALLAPDAQNTELPARNLFNKPTTFRPGDVSVESITDGADQFIGISFASKKGDEGMAAWWGKQTTKYPVEKYSTLTPGQKATTVPAPWATDDPAKKPIFVYLHSGPESFKIKPAGRTLRVDGATLADVALSYPRFRQALTGRPAAPIVLLACESGKLDQPGGGAHDFRRALGAKGYDRTVYAPTETINLVPAFSGINVDGGGRFTRFGQPGGETFDPVAFERRWAKLPEGERLDRAVRQARQRMEEHGIRVPIPPDGSQPYDQISPSGQLVRRVAFHLFHKNIDGAEHTLASTAVDGRAAPALHSESRAGESTSRTTDGMVGDGLAEPPPSRASGLAVARRAAVESPIEVADAPEGAASAPREGEAIADDAEAGPGDTTSPGPPSVRPPDADRRSSARSAGEEPAVPLAAGGSVRQPSVQNVQFDVVVSFKQGSKDIEVTPGVWTL